jgi:hypothetical protein
MSDNRLARAGRTTEVVVKIQANPAPADRQRWCGYGRRARQRDAAGLLCEWERSHLTVALAARHYFETLLHFLDYIGPNKPTIHPMMVMKNGEKVTSPSDSQGRSAPALLREQAEVDARESKRVRR